jgi:AAA domain, putative AbiEii toxin, Type IV TA system
MLKSIVLDGFTVFRKAEVQFSPGLNIVIGENGYGKSHLLKLGYCVSWFSDSLASQAERGNEAPHGLRGLVLGEKLLRVFRPESVGRLASRVQGRKRASVRVGFTTGPTADLAFSFATNSRQDVTIDRLPSRPAPAPSVFLPTKEVISMYPGFTALYRDYHLEIDETYYDLCLALERPLTRGPKEAKTKPLLEPIEALLHGSVANFNGRFILRIPGQGNMEMPLVAEGFRKLATIAYLIANGTLRDKAVLFWDEPETNLNARYLRDVVRMLVEIAKLGVQIVLATHSLFFLREAEILLSDPANAKLPRHYVALGGKPGNVTVSQGPTVESIEPVLALDEEIAQSERYLASH